MYHVCLLLLLLLLFNGGHYVPLQSVWQYRDSANIIYTARISYSKGNLIQSSNKPLALPPHPLSLGLICKRGKKKKGKIKSKQPKSENHKNKQTFFFNIFQFSLA